MDLLAAWLLYPLALAVLCLGLGAARRARWRLAAARACCCCRSASPRCSCSRGSSPPRGDRAARRCRRSPLLAAGRARARPRAAARAAPRSVARWSRALGVVRRASPRRSSLSGEPTLRRLPRAARHRPPARARRSCSPTAGRTGGRCRTGSTHERRRAVLHRATTRSRAQALLGVTAPLGIIDLAWLYQPLLSFIALAAVPRARGARRAPLLRRRWQAARRRVRGGAVGARDRLRAAGVDQGDRRRRGARLRSSRSSRAAIRERRPARSLLALAIAAAAALGALGPAALPYLAVPALVVLGVVGPSGSCASARRASSAG